MEEIKNNGGIRTTAPYIERFRDAVEKFETRIKDWREIYETKIENSGKGLANLQEHEIEMAEKELSLRIVEKAIMEAVNLIIERGEFLQELSEESLRIYPINCLRHKKNAMNMLNGTIDFLIQLEHTTNNDLTNGNGGQKEIISLIMGEGDFWRSDENGKNAIERFFKCLN